QWRRWRSQCVTWPIAITLMKTRPTMSMPRMTFRPSVAASASVNADTAGATLADAAAVRGERRVDGLGAGGLAREVGERPGVAAEAERVARRPEVAGSEQRSGRRPHGAVPVGAVRAELRAE